MNDWDDIEEFFDDEWCDVAEFKNNQDYRVASTKKDETRKGLIVTLQDKYAT